MKYNTKTSDERVLLLFHYRCIYSDVLSRVGNNKQKAKELFKRARAYYDGAMQLYHSMVHARREAISYININQKEQI